VGTGRVDGLKADAASEKCAGDETEVPIPAGAVVCWSCIIELSASRSLPREGSEAPGGGIASGRGDGGAGHFPGRAAAVSTRLLVR